MAEQQEEQSPQVQDFSVDDESMGSVVKIFSIPQSCVPRIIGPDGSTIRELKANFACSIAINQETKEKGYSVCTVRGETDESVGECKAKVDTLSEESKMNASKEVQIPQKYVGMIIGAAGVTLQKIRKHTGASIEVMQETANDGFSVAHVSGSLEQVDKTVDVISKMVVSGRQASEGYQEYLKNVQAGLVPAAPFKPDKMPGLEFLEDDDHPHGGKSAPSKGHKSGKGKDMGYTPRGKVGDNGEVRGGFVGGGVGIKGGSGKGIAFVDASKHTLSDTFEVPQKYVGLLVGKQGEAIRRFRQYAAERDMAIRVNQDDNGAAASVVITGNDMDDIVALKADMTQNLFQAIAKLDANGPKGGDHKGGYGKKGKGKGKMNNYHHHKGHNSYHDDHYGGSGSFDRGNTHTPEVYYGPTGGSGKGGNGKGYNTHGPYGGGNKGGGKNYNQDDGDWWANVFNQVLQGQQDKSGDYSQAQQQNDWGNQGNNWGNNNNSNQGASSMSDGDLGSALAALLSAPTGGNQSGGQW